MVLLENNVDDYKQLIELERKLTQKKARPKYTKDTNVHEKFKGWSRKEIKRYINLIKVVRLGRDSQVSKKMEIELKLKYARICEKNGVRNGLEDYSDSDDSDGEDLEAQDGFAGDLTVINVERTAAV